MSYKTLEKLFGEGATPQLINAEFRDRGIPVRGAIYDACLDAFDDGTITSIQGIFTSALKEMQS